MKRSRVISLVLALMLLIPASLLVFGGVALAQDEPLVEANCEVNAPEGVDTDASVDVEDEDDDDDPEVDVFADADVIEDEEGEDLLECRE